MSIKETCNKCGNEVVGDRKLDDKVWNCPTCGLEEYQSQSSPTEEMGVYLFKHYEDKDKELKIAVKGKIMFISGIGDIGEYSLDNMKLNTIDKECCVVIVEEGITELERAIFCYRSNLEYVTLPSSLTWISAEAFEGCKKLKHVHLAGNNLSQIGRCAFLECISIEEIILPESLNLISEAAFCKCTELRTIILPKGVKEVEAEAFKYCKNLKAIEIQNPNIIIGEDAFKGCQRLVDIKAPEHITKKVLEQIY